jgi:phenylacetate-coenzyme A ligase PaaK-like adenylate-forming protein
MSGTQGTGYASEGSGPRGWALPGGGGFDAWHAVNAAWDVWAGSQADAATLARRAGARLADLLTTARASPYFETRLRSLGDPARIRLEDIEPTSRGELMARFDDWCTDREVTRERVDAFLADPQRVGDAFLGRYAVWTSSGTTGTPGIYVHDAHALAVYDALEMLRFRGLDHPNALTGAFARLASAPWRGGERFAMVGATGGHFAGNSSVERMRRLGPWVAPRARVVSIMQPLPQLVAALEAFRPTVLATYPTSAELLAGEQLAGRLHLSLDEVWTGGEHLSAPVRAQVERAFGCRLRDGYGASEFMAIAFDCRQGSLHVNSDWVILEPVDRDYRPVAPGEASHTVLLTNLANRVQPLIRYDLGDSVVPQAGCRCGSAFPAIRVEGRTDDVLQFARDGGTVKLLPLALVTVLEDDAGVFEFQLLQTGAHQLSLRLAPGTADLAQARRRCHAALQHYLRANGLPDVRIHDDARAPQRSDVSGKLRRIVRVHGSPAR